MLCFKKKSSNAFFYEMDKLLQTSLTIYFSFYFFFMIKLAGYVNKHIKTPAINIQQKISKHMYVRTSINSILKLLMVNLIKIEVYFLLNLCMTYQI